MSTQFEVEIAAIDKRMHRKHFEIREAEVKRRQLHQKITLVDLKSRELQNLSVRLKKRNKSFKSRYYSIAEPECESAITYPIAAPYDTHSLQR